MCNVAIFEEDRKENNEVPPVAPIANEAPLPLARRNEDAAPEQILLRPVVEPLVVQESREPLQQ